MGDIKASGFGGIPFGNTANRPAAEIGRLYSNGQEGRLELYTSNGWSNIVQETPSVSSVSGQLNESTSSTVTISGTNFAAGAVAYIIGTDGIEVSASSVTFISANGLSAVFPAMSPSFEPYDVKVVNPSNLFGVIYDALSVNNVPVWSTSAGSLGTFTELQSVSLSVLATDETDATNSSLSYSLVSGTLPPGLSLNSSTGVISGTLSADIVSNTTYIFSLSVTDGRNTSSTRQFSITINDRAPVWSTSAGSLGTYAKNSVFSTTVVGTDDSGVSPTYSLLSGSLPTGLSLNSTTGVISGTPSVSSPLTYSFTLRITDNGGNTSDRSFTLTNISPVWSTSTTLPSFTRTSPYSTTLLANDDGTVTYSLFSGTLPTGLSLNSSTGVISGTPTSSTNASFTIRATDDSGNTADRSFTLPNSSPVWSTSGALTSSNVGSVYSYQLVATDDSGVSPTYALVSGALPTGLSISSSGLISGTIGSSGSFNFVVSATDQNGGSTNSVTLSLNVTNIVVTGGTLTTDGTYLYRTFTSTGTLAISGGTITGTYIMGGGGAGGASGNGGAYGGGGGGGAGGFREPNSAVLTGSYGITIGAGGSGGPNGNNGTPGSTTSFNGISAGGGGNGGQGGGTSGAPGSNGGGGSGGGGGGYAGGNYSGGSAGGVGLSNAGGATGGNNAGGGGGGASGAGTNGNSGAHGGAAYSGLTSWTSTTGIGVNGAFCGGGGGAFTNSASAGTTTGGGGNTAGGAASANSGSGGAGGGNAPFAGGNGASGFVIVRYQF